MNTAKAPTDPVRGDGVVGTSAPVAAVTAPRAASWRTVAKRLLARRELSLLPVIAACIVAGSFVSPRFMTFDNLTNVLQQCTELGLLVIAASLILIAGKFDLSLESTFGLAPMLGIFAVVGVASTEQRINPYLGILIMFAVGAAIGSFNGLLIVRYQMNAFIVTLAVLIIVRGLILVTSSGQTLYNLPPEMTYLGSATWFRIPVSVYVLAAVFGAAAWFTLYHTAGRAIYALGGNRRAARAAGVQTRRLLFCTFVIGGILAALAGLLNVGRLASVSSTTGQNMIFTTMAAAVIGGIGLDGGRGTMTGAMTGVLLLTLVQNVLTFAQVPSFWIDATYGAVILLALALARFTTGEREDED